MNYAEFLKNKEQLGGFSGFNPPWIPDCLFDFQKSLVDWAIRKGRAALFEDTGLGKTLQQLVWAENVVRKTNGRVLLLTPIAVGAQTETEAARFGIEAQRSNKPGARITIANYERLHQFDANDFTGVVCDESSILKNFDGTRKRQITEFMRLRPYRLLCTATAAPNDYIELGTSSEALGELGYVDMLKTFFKSSDNKNAQGGSNGFNRRDPFGGKFRFRGHSADSFWRWVCSWARAIRKPSDIGGDDSRYILPPLVMEEHAVKVAQPRPGFLFALPATGLKEQRAETRHTLTERCAYVAGLVANTKRPAVCWCNLNDEGDLLTNLLSDSGAVQVSGGDSEDEKEEKLIAFAAGQIRVLVTKPKIAGFGLNWQHCAHQTFFPSHSYEQFYQGVRRCHRFGQKSSVKIDVVTSDGEVGVLDNLKRKSAAADAMFARLVALMNNHLSIQKTNPFVATSEKPSWM